LSNQDPNASNRPRLSLGQEDPLALSQRLAEEPPPHLQGATPISGPPPVRKPHRETEPKPKPTPLMQKATRLMSAQDALKAAIAAEGDAPPTSRPAEASSSCEPGKIVLDLVPNAHIHRTLTVSNPDVFTALWRAHRVRAAHEGNLAVVGVACALLHAVQQLPNGKLTAVHLELEGASFAAWVDTVSGTLLGVVEPADLYLAGL
jgi:hypothetical protein